MAELEPNVAVLIDYENVGLDSIKDLLEQLTSDGRVTIRRAYGDWSVQRGKQDQLLELGIEPIHQYHSNKSGKNSSDIRLAIEAIDLLHESPIDIFVIVSSDSDFVPLVGRLRSSGKTVIAAGRREATSPTLIKSCDRFIFLESEKAADDSPTPSRRRTSRRVSGSSGPATRSSDPRSLLLRAMDVSVDESGRVVGSKLYQTMRRIEPSFNYKDLRHRIFSQFLESHSDIVGVIRPKDGSGDVIVQLLNTEGLSAGRQSARRYGRVTGRQSTAAASSEQAAAGQQDGDEKPRVRRIPMRRPQAERGEGTAARSDRRSPRQRAMAQAAAAAEDASEEEAAASGEDVQADQAEPVAASASERASDAGAKDAAGKVSWEVEVDAAWGRRDMDRISGPAAARDAANVLGSPKLSESAYPSLAKLLAASTLLQLNWRREGNAIIRK